MNPYSHLINDLGLTIDSQRELATQFALFKVLEASYVSGFDGTVSPGRYAVEQLKATCGALSPFVRRLEQMLVTSGKMNKR